MPAVQSQCDSCSCKFSWLKKKRTCIMCRSVCCSACMQRLRCCSVGRHCLRCARLGFVRYERSTLQQMTVRDLKHIMKIVNVSSATCREKSDLVDKILLCDRTGGRSQQAPAPAPAAPRRPRPHASIRVSPRDSIRVRPMDEAEPAPHTKQPSFAADSESPSDDSRRGSDEPPRSSAPPEERDDDDDVQVSPLGGPAEPEPDLARRSGRHSSESDDGVANRAFVDTDDLSPDGEGASEEIVVDDDLDEPAAESTNVEPEPERSQRQDDVTAPDAEIDLSTLTDVAELPSEDLIARLTVRQCKQLLQHRRTEYRGVIEKEELLRRLRLLWRETRRNRDALASAPEHDICKICMDALVDCVMLECGHMATCTACGKQMAECPICRKYVVRVVHVFRS